MFTPFPYLNYYYKYLGLIIAIIGTLLMIFPGDYGKFSGWLLLFGLFIVAYSKDNKDNQELIKNYRHNSFRITFAITFTLIIITTFRNIVADYSNELNIVIFGIIYLLLYNAIYYMHFILGIKNMATDQDLSENYKRNKTLYLISYSFIAVAVTILILYIVLKH